MNTLIRQVEPYKGASAAEIRNLNISLEPTLYSTLPTNGENGEGCAAIALTLNTHLRITNDEQGRMVKETLRAVKVRTSMAEVYLSHNNDNEPIIVAYDINEGIAHSATLDKAYKLHKYIVKPSRSPIDLTITVEDGRVFKDNAKLMSKGNSGKFTVLNSNKTLTFISSCGTIYTPFRDKIFADTGLVVNSSTDLLGGKFLSTKLRGWTPENGFTADSALHADYVAPYTFNGGSFEYMGISLDSPKAMDIFASGLELSYRSLSVIDPSNGLKCRTFSIREGKKDDWHQSLCRLIDESVEVGS
jgi:hypothetical protein